MVLTSWRADVRYEAEVLRTWVSDLDGTGLEGDVTDSVEVPCEAMTGELTDFHARAIAEVLRRLESDFEVADLFCYDQALGLG